VAGIASPDARRLSAMADKLAILDGDVMDVAQAQIPVGGEARL
jgi:hypothetical protein